MDAPEVEEMSVPDSAFCAWRQSQNVNTGGRCGCGHEGLGPGWHSADCAGANQALEDKVRQLFDELFEQWAAAHYDHCGPLDNELCPKAEQAAPNDCQWPPPPALRY